MRFAIFRNVGLLLIVSASLDCKPRRSLSDLAENGGFNETFLEIQKEIAALDARFKLYSEGQMPLLDETVSKHVEETQGKGKNKIDPPDNCPEDLWNQDLSWNNAFLVDLDKKAKESPHLLVRLHAIKLIAIMTNRGSVDCAAQKIDEIVFEYKALRDTPPDQELLLPGATANASYACTSLLRCSVAIEVAVMIGSTFPNADTAQKMTAAIRESIKPLKIPDISRTVLNYRLDSADAYVEFMRATQYHDPAYHGSFVVLDAAQAGQLTQQFDRVLSTFRETYISLTAQPEALVTKDGAIANLIENTLVKQDLAKKDDQVWDLGDSESKRMAELAVEIYQPAIDNHRFNLGMRHYIDRLLMSDPKPWLDKIRSQVTAQRRGREIDGLPANWNITEEERSRILSSQGIAANNGGIEPIAAFMALTNFIDHEVYLPFRSDFRATINFVVEQMNRREKFTIFPKAVHVDSVFRAFDFHQKSYANNVASLPGSDLQLPPEKMEEVQRLRRTFRRLMAIETDIVRKKDQQGNLTWAGFQSVHHQMNRYNALMIARGAAMNKLVDYAKEPWTKHFFDRVLKIETADNPFASTVNKYKTKSAWADALLIPWWTRVPVPTNVVIFNPDNLGNRLQFDLDYATGDLIGQYLVIECADRILTNEGRAEKGMILKDQTFFIDDSTKINFECRPEWTYTDLVTKAFAYGRSTGKDKAEDKLARAIKDHPLLHTAMMVAMSAVIPHFSAVLLRSIAIAGRLVPNVIRTAWYARYIMTLGKLVLDSFIFGVGDFYFRQVIDTVLGIKMTPEEAAAHTSAIFNWRGIMTGALIFGIIPMAHGPVDKLVRGLLGPNVLGTSLYNRTIQNAIFRTPFNRGAVQQLTTSELTRVGALWTLSTGAQMTAETSIFVFHPMLEEEMAAYWQQLKGTYREPGEMEKIWRTLHEPRKVEQIIASALTVTAFTTNRMMGHGVRSSGLDYRVDRQMQFWGTRTRSRSYMQPGFVPHLEFALPKEANKQQVEQAFGEYMEVISKDVQQLKSGGKFSPEVQFIYATEIRRRVLARRMLTEEMDWTKVGPPTSAPELQKYGLEFALDRKLDKDPLKTNNRERDAIWLRTYENIFTGMSNSGLPRSQNQAPQPGTINDAPMPPIYE
jgi:hypothetical protein